MKEKKSQDAHCNEAFLICVLISVLSLRSGVMIPPRYLHILVNGIMLFALLRIRSVGISSEFLASSRVVMNYIALVLDLVEELLMCI